MLRNILRNNYCLIPKIIAAQTGQTYNTLKWINLQMRSGSHVCISNKVNMFSGVRKLSVWNLVIHTIHWHRRNDIRWPINFKISIIIFKYHCIFLHAKPWLPDGEKSTFMDLIRGYWPGCEDVVRPASEGARRMVTPGFWRNHSPCSRGCWTNNTRANRSLFPL